MHQSYSNHNNSRRIPDSVIYGNNSSTPRKQTMIRNQSFQNRHYNQDIIQMIAKIRSLEDDLISQKFKNQSLQRKCQQYERTIDNLEYEMTSLNYQLDKYRHEVQLSNQKNLQIMKYEHNLQIIGEEIQQLNQVLIRKNKDYENLLLSNRDLQYHAKKRDEQNQLLTVRNGIWAKEIDNLLDEFKTLILLADKNKTNNKFSSASNLLNQKDQIEPKFELIRQIISYLEKTLRAKTHQFQVKKKQLLTQNQKSKEEYVRLQYQHKLLHERTKDNQRQHDLMKACYNEKKVEEIVEEMLQKQDELMQRIDQLSIENEEFREQLKQNQQNNSFSDKIQKRQQSSIIQSLKKQNSFLERTITELEHKLNDIQHKYEQVRQITSHDTHRQLQTDLVMMKKYRKIQEENLQYRVRIEELLSQVNLLNKEMDILRGD